MEYATSLTFIAFIVLLLAGLPIGFVLPLCGFGFLFLSDSTSAIAIPSDMMDGISGFILLAIPFFIWAGFLMTQGGMTGALSDFLGNLLGHLRGGLLQAVVASMYIFSGISGSKAADVAAVGSTMTPILRQNGYSASRVAAVLAGAAVMGETIPPSIAMLVMGSITTISIGTLFIAGLLPATLLAICISVTIFFQSRNGAQRPKPRASLKTMLRSTVKALPAMLTPVILIGGILGGIGTPTEISSIAVVYALLLMGEPFKRVTWKRFWSVAVETAIMSGMILFIISGAVGFSRALTIAQIPEQLVGLLSSLGGVSVFLVCTLVLLTVMGGLFEGLPALVVFTPLLMPTAIAFGIDPIHYAVVLIIAMGLGSFAPPLGVGLYVACAVCDVTMEQVVRPLAPYLAVLLVGLILITFFPELTLALRKRFGDRLWIWA